MGARPRQRATCRGGMDGERDAGRSGEKGRINGGGKEQGGDIDVCSVTVAAGWSRRKRARK